MKGTNPNGKRFLIALGGEPAPKRTSSRTVLTRDLGIRVDRFHFLERSLSGESLALGGGINCRTQALGDVR